MAIYLKKFETQAAYEAAQSSLIKPNVSLITETHDVEYNPIVRVSGVSLNKNELSLNKGDTETLVATVLPSDASNKNVTWSSSNDSVATVSSNGLVTAVGVGNATVTVTTDDGRFTAQCNTIITAPVIDGHEYVDLGLPSGTKWATMNVGASSETDYGDYYMYGLTAKYNQNQSNYKGVENPLATSADTAAQVWGGSWHMPTSARCQELIDNTTREWTTINGVRGGKFTASNGNYVFFLPAGLKDRGTGYGMGTSCNVWASTPLNNNTSYACYLYCDSNSSSVSNQGQRWDGRSIRPVVG
jgi:hypothetical protein